MKRKLLSILTAVTMLIGLMPQTAFAAQTGSSDASRTVFDALGFDTRAPAGYEQEEGITDTPFGKTYTTMAEVDELFLMDMNSKKGELYGDGYVGGDNASFFNEGNKNIDISAFPDATSSQMIEGNFSTANNGQKKNIVALSSYYKSGSYSWRLETTDVNGKTGSPIFDQFISATGSSTTPAKLYTGCALTAGDFDGDGIDEIAFAETDLNRFSVTVYKLQKTSGDSYLDSKNWMVATKFKSNKLDVGSKNTHVNMMSLVAADVNKDGIDDLALACGSYYTDAEKYYSKVAVAWGADQGRMLLEQTPVDIGNVYRAGLTVSDLNNDGRNELIIGGNTKDDASDRYAAIYAWNGSSFDQLASKSINTTDDLDGTYRSLATNVANLTVGSFYGIDEGPCIYLDSIILKYGSGGITVLDLVEWTNLTYAHFLGNFTKSKYSEWGARTADFFGNGKEVVGSNMSLSGKSAQAYAFARLNNNNGKRTVGVFTDDGCNADNVYKTRAIPFCLPNTDNDTIVLRYTGKHYYTYADPEVLAVLASPPYYADLANEDDDSQMIESKTSYSSSHGSGGGSTYSNSFSVGVYTSWEHSFKIFNVEVAHAEAEASINNTFTWETQQTSSVEYEIEYSTMAGMDSVVMYALPVETYVYEATMTDGTKQMMTVNKPYSPSVRTIPADEYSDIQKVYSDILPDVSGVLTHTIGDPASYASDISALPDGRSQTLVYDGNFAAVGQGSQNTITQSIAMTTEKENSFNYDLDIETKAGAGAGGITVGVTAGYSHGAGSVHITTAGSTYSGEMNGLPTQAKNYGYTFNWKLVSFLYQGKYPVVTYLVNDATEPPLLPENFGANEDETTTDRIALEWDHSGNAAGFIIYRYFQSPSSSGYYKIGTVEGDSYSEVIDGVRHYQYIDTELNADSSYQYRIQTIGSSQPNASIPSEALRTYTKPESGVPLVAVSDNNLDTYPDISLSTTAYITNSDEFKNAKIYYQWQKKSGRNWKNVAGEDAATLTFQYPDKGVEGLYRCKVSVLTGHNLVTAYSPETTVTFTQRKSEIKELKIDGNNLTAVVKGIGTYSKPSGTVNFILSATDGTQTVYTANVKADGKAEVTVDKASAMYKLSATYSGSKIFLPASYEPEEPLFYAEGVQNGSFVDVKDSYVYGDEFNFIKYTITDGNVTSEIFKPDEKAWNLSGLGDNAVRQRFYDGYAGNVYTGKVDYYFWDGGGSHLGEKHYITIVPHPLTVTGLPETLTVSIDDLSTAEERESLQNKLLHKLKIDGVVDKWDQEKFSLEKLSIRIQKQGYLWSDLTANSSITPGVYTMKPGLTGLGNYDASICTGKLIILGTSYPVSARVADEQQTFGSVSVAYPENVSSSAVGQTLIFKASANPGYTVKQWIDANTNEMIEGSAGIDTLTLTQTDAGTNVIVEFQKKRNTLTTSVSPANAGRVTTEDKYFKNGNAYNSGYEINFTAEPNDGWHFVGWEYFVTGQNAVYGDEETYTVLMPDNSVQLLAKFERDTYKLTLSEGLAAYDKNGNHISDLSAVTGDTEITVKPAAGYTLDTDAEWSVNGVPLDPQPENGEYSFTMMNDVSISVPVIAQTFSIVLNAENLTGGTADLTGVNENGTAVAGTNVTFAAEPARGYDFTGWTNESDVTVSTSTNYTFTVSGDITLRPVFTEKTSKTFNVGEKLEWEITDAAGNVIETDTEKLYPGETLKLTAQPRSGDMVKGWTLNDNYIANTTKTRMFDYNELSDSNDFTVTFQPVTYFKVEFVDNVTAKADSKTIASGDDVAAGSKMIFSYNGSDGNVTIWKNGETEYPLMKDLIIEALSEDLNITLQTGELTFFKVEDSSTETDNHYTVNVTGTYEDNDRYAENSSVTVTVMPESGFSITDVSCEAAEFINDEASGIWKADIESITDNISYTVSTEKIIPKYTLTFNTNGGSDIASVTDKENSVIDISKYVPSKSGYKFNGWFTDSELKTAAGSSITLTGDITLYAGWTSGSSSGGGGGGGGSSSGGSGSTTTPVTPPSTDPTPGTSDNTITIGDVTDASGNKLETTAGKDGSVTVKTGSDKDSVIIADIKKAGPGTAAYIVKPDGTEELVRDSVVLNGRLYMNIPDGAVIKAADRSTKFSDVDERSWSADAIAFVSGHGLFNGTSADSFSPSAEMTREMLMTVIARLNGADTSGDALAKGMAWAVENGISDGSNPKGSITREQIAAMLYRNAGEPDVTYDSSHLAKFSDASEISGYAEKAMLWAAEAGIINGTTDNRLLPRANATREQVAQMMLNYVSSLYR